MNNSLVNDIVVVDTNVVSYIFKRDTRESLYKPHLQGRVRIIAAQTFAELEAWPLMNGDFDAAQHFELIFKRTLLQRLIEQSACNGLECKLMRGGMDDRLRKLMHGSQLPH